MNEARLNVDAIRQDFPVLQQQIQGNPLVYLDNAATTQKPQQVIDAITQYYEQYNANVHRSVHTLGARATEQFEAARCQVQQWINAPRVHECIFVRGTTEAINLVANSYLLPVIQAGDEILITHLEHHSNIVPWQMVCQKTGAILKVAPLNAKGEVQLEAFERLLSDKTRMVAISYASNALGTINPIRDMVEMAHAKGAVVLVDGAQATAHFPVDVQKLGCDFYAFSGHKMYGPTGIGVLWGKEELLEQMSPWQGGGEMIQYVTFEQTEYAPLPYRFEAGTPHIEGVIGLGAAISYLKSLPWEAVLAHETDLLAYATRQLQQVNGVRLIGVADAKVPVISFVHESIHAHDIGTILDTEGVAIRSGHHCAMPVMDFFQVAATTRVSLSFYNTRQDIDACVAALNRVNKVFGV